ncbi:uncharacterized protein LOC133179238 [Saccostrea echinata]|uniref:uncharacterized protein LOC133179238 n=1 Tax=Saccostrea echinata TaxID=191078 RepID=UPI002A7F5E09|nr:uncharacterized protein LOC133179238 [Saccostrea echinata]
MLPACFKQAKGKSEPIFGEKLYDAIIVYSPNDKDKALNFLSSLKRDILRDENCFQIALFDDPRISSINEAFQTSSVAFVLLTKDFCECDWPGFSSNQVVMESLYTKTPCTIVPVILPNEFGGNMFKIPMGLKCMKQLRLNFEDELVRESVSRFLTLKIRQRLSKMMEV